jgi:hypothetical protein
MVLYGHSRRSGTAHPFTQRAGAVSRACIKNPVMAVGRERSNRREPVPMPDIVRKVGQKCRAP